MKWYQHRVVREQWLLLLIMLLMSLLLGFQTFGPEGSDERFMVVPLEITTSWQAVLSGEATVSQVATLCTLFTNTMLHGDAGHLMFNLLFLWIFAVLAVELLGPRWMLAVFFLTAVSGSLGHVFLNPLENHHLLGASGVVMGFEGLYLGMAVRWRLPDPHVFPLARPVPPANLGILTVVGISFDYYRLMEHADINIAYGAHLGGFIMGLFLACFVLPKPTLAPVSYTHLTLPTKRIV